MRAWKIEGQQVRLVERLKPVRPPGWARLEPVVAGICATDYQLLKGYAHFQGVPGHEFVARVVECDQPGWLGRRVVGEINVGCDRCPDARFCPHRQVLGIRELDGAFGESFLLPERNLHAVDDLDPEVACWCEPLAAALDVHNFIGPGESVLVQGDGRLGALVALGLRERNPVRLVGRHPEKLARLAGLGLSVCDEIGEEYPNVVEASGQGEGLALAMRRCRAQGQVVVKTTVAQCPALDWSPLVVKQLRVVGSRCGDFKPALEALRSGRVDPRPLVDHRFPFEQLDQALEARGGFKTLVSGPVPAD